MTSWPRFASTLTLSPLRLVTSLSGGALLSLVSALFLAGAVASADEVASGAASSRRSPAGGGSFGREALSSSFANGLGESLRPACAGLRCAGDGARWDGTGLTSDATLGTGDPFT
jgi:hypothetical protein